MTSSKRWVAEHAGFAASLLVLAVAAKAIFGRVGAFDLGFDDECWIMDVGLKLPAHPLPPPDYGPLYAVWYRVLGAVEPDPVPLYTFNWVVLQLASIALLYLLSRRSGAPRFAAGLAAILWSLSRAVTIWPFAVYFSTTILALGALATTFTKDRLVSLTLLVMATAAASFVRPELAIPGMPLALVAIVWSVTRALRSRRPRALGSALAVAATIAVLVGVFGTPLGGGRSYFAFQQHYAWHRVEAGKLDVDPMSMYEPIVTADFPHARSIGEAALENPSAFVWHLRYNTRILLDRLTWFLEVDDYVPLGLKIAIAAGAGVVLALGAYALVRRWRRLPPHLRGWLPIWVPVGASFAAAALLIHPRDHYLVPFSFFAIATLASACGALTWRPGRLAPYVRPAGFMAAGLLLALLPTYRRGALPSLLAARGTPPPTEWQGRNTVEALRALDLPGERVVFDAEFSRAVFARIPFRWVAINEKDRPFSQFLRDNDIDVVIITPRLREDARFRDDPEFRSFIEWEGDHLGFILSQVPRADVRIAYRPR
jgi:hypothetical protein